MDGMPTKIHHHFTRTKYQNNLSGLNIVFNSKKGMTIKSMSRLHDLVLCLAEMISYMCYCQIWLFLDCG